MSMTHWYHRGQTQVLPRSIPVTEDGRFCYRGCRTEMADEDQDQRALKVSDRSPHRLRKRAREVAGKVKDGIARNWRGVARSIGDKGVRGAFAAASRLGQGDPALDSTSEQYRSFVVCFAGYRAILSTVIDIAQSQSRSPSHWGSHPASWTKQKLTWDYYICALRQVTVQANKVVSLIHDALPQESKEAWRHSLMKVQAHLAELSRAEQEILDRVKAKKDPPIGFPIARMIPGLGPALDIERELIAIGSGFERSFDQMISLATP